MLSVENIDFFQDNVDEIAFNLQLARILPSSTGGEMNCKNRKNNTEHLFWL